jgi:hypothetical protein
MEKIENFNFLLLQDGAEYVEVDEERAKKGFFCMKTGIYKFLIKDLNALTLCIPEGDHKNKTRASFLQNQRSCPSILEDHRRKCNKRPDSCVSVRIVYTYSRRVSERERERERNANEKKKTAIVLQKQ